MLLLLLLLLPLLLPLKQLLPMLPDEEAEALLLLLLLRRQEALTEGVHPTLRGARHVAPVDRRRGRGEIKAIVSRESLPGHLRC